MGKQQKLFTAILCICLASAPVTSYAKEQGVPVTAVVQDDTGAYKIKINKEGNAPVFKAPLAQDDVKSAVATPEDQIKVDSEGYTLTAIITVKPVTVASGLGMDITLDKIITDSSGVVAETANVTQTAAPIKLSFAAPDEIVNADGSLKTTDYVFERTHDGIKKELPVEYNKDTKMFSFSTDKFSLYTFAYTLPKDVSVVPAAGISNTDKQTENTETKESVDDNAAALIGSTQQLKENMPVAENNAATVTSDLPDVKPVSVQNQTKHVAAIDSSACAVSEDSHGVGQIEQTITSGGDAPAQNNQNVISPEKKTGKNNFWWIIALAAMAICISGGVVAKKRNREKRL